MAQYAIAFDLDTTAMTHAGLTPSDRTKVYQKEIPEVGIYLTQVAPTCSMAGYGGIPAQPEGV